MSQRLKPDCYDYVRRCYRVPAYIGVRVRVRDREGVLVSPERGRSDQYLHIWFDGETRARGPYHATDGVAYLIESPASVDAVREDVEATTACPRAHTSSQEIPSE